MALGVLWSWPWMVAALVILGTVCIALQNHARRSSKGMASLPVIGDSVQFFRGPRDFLIDYFARYGDPFTISVMGQKATVVNSPEVIKFVLSTAHTSFPGAYSKQFQQLLAEGKFATPTKHPYYRKAVLAVVSGDGLVNLLPVISSLAEKTVKSWENQAVVNTVDELQKFVFTVSLHVIRRDVKPDSEEMEHCREEMSLVLGGLGVVPINFPGFNFHKALKAREVLVSRIQKAISKRRETGSKVKDLLNGLMSIKEVEVPDYDICCLMLGITFASFATTASLIPWVVKYLHDFPEVRQRVQDEQDIIRQKMIEEKSLTWFKPRSSMPYTLQVIYEIMRIEALVPFIPRVAKKDVDYNGYVFRKGSHVWASTTLVQFNPDYYPNPREFDPSRFEEKPKSNTFMVFGQGPHLCPGSELALTETMFIIHHLITNYSWERIGPDQGVMYKPLRKPGGGFPISVVKRRVT